MEKAYQVLYSDPPRRYDFSKSNSRQIENQYPTMTTEDICAIQVPSADNAVLYLWATAPKLKDALRVMESWNFEYKTHLIWDKITIGIGYWARGQHELLLVGVKGKFSPPIPSLRVGSVIRIKRTIHSRKPAEIRNLIASWYPNETKLEMFARQRVEGWDAFGNQVVSDVDIETKEQEPEEKVPTIIEVVKGDSLWDDKINRGLDKQPRE